MRFRKQEVWIQYQMCDRLGRLEPIGSLGLWGPESEEIISCKIWNQQEMENVKSRTREIYRDRSRTRGSQRTRTRGLWWSEALEPEGVGDCKA